MVVNPVQVQTVLAGVDYPAEKEDLVDYATTNDADDDVINALSQLPDDTYETPADVSEAISDLDVDDESGDIVGDTDSEAIDEEEDDVDVDDALLDDDDEEEE